MNTHVIAQAAIEALREQGFAVAVFTPDQLQGIDPEYVEAHLIESGWEVINAFGLQEYKVVYFTEDESEQFLFECQATDINHVIEQFEDAYPEASILAIELQH